MKNEDEDEININELNELLKEFNEKFDLYKKEKAVIASTLGKAHIFSAEDAKEKFGSESLAALLYCEFLPLADENHKVTAQSWVQDRWVESAYFGLFQRALEDLEKAGFITRDRPHLITHLGRITDLYNYEYDWTFSDAKLRSDKNEN